MGKKNKKPDKPPHPKRRRLDDMPIVGLMQSLTQMGTLPYDFDPGDRGLIQRYTAGTLQTALEKEGGDIEMGESLKEWNEGFKFSSPFRILSPFQKAILAGRRIVRVVRLIRPPSKSETWFKTPVKDKSMVPNRKIGKLFVDGDILTDPQPEDFWAAIRQFFVHTATFDPVDRQGRDMLSEEGGGYYRSTDNLLKDYFREVAKINLEKALNVDVAGLTIRPVNDALFEILETSGKVSANLGAREMYYLKTDDSMAFAVFKSTHGLHFGSLGVLTNSVKVMRMAVRLSIGKIKPKLKTVPLGDEIIELQNIVGLHLLQPAGNVNYHDLMIRDRGELVQEITDWLNSAPLSFLKKNGLEAIQSPGHPSIILYHNLHPDSKTEEDWRNRIMSCFNEAAEELGFATRLNRRSSFGFLYPTASSVGGPVRIWPGLVPAGIFKAIMRSALLKADYTAKKTDPGKVPEIKNEANKIVLHTEALKAAVLHVYAVLQNALSRSASDKIYNWIITRLRRNLDKARFLLELSSPFGKADLVSLELRYQKSSLVIENLMEYGYLLTAVMNRRDRSKDDSYPEYVMDTLVTDEQEKKDFTTGKKQFSVFYLDSGMQAIAVASLLAKAQLASTQPDPVVLDINSYFEYSIIDKSNLKLILFKPGQKEAPDIISVDLSPVLTQPGQQVLDYSKELDKYSKSKKEIIPIIDVTNSTLTKAAELQLGSKYTNYIILESLSKHEQLGADKFTMGRLVAVGSPAFIRLAEKIVRPVAVSAADPLWLAYRENMDDVFYGKGQESGRLKNFAKQAKDYNEFMKIIGADKKWSALTAGFGKEDETPDRMNVLAAISMLQKIFNEYITTAIWAKLPALYQDAYRYLPSADRNEIQRKRSEKFVSGKSGAEKPFGFGFKVANVTNTGILNIGNSCYFASGLNMLAFSPYRGICEPVAADSAAKADLRAALLALITEVRSGTLVEKDKILALLIKLNKLNLLPPPSLNDIERGLTSITAQHDPNEVFFRKIFDYLGIRQEATAVLTIKHLFEIQDEGHFVFGADPGKYSLPDQYGRISRTGTEIVLELPVNQIRDLAGILKAYFAVEPDVDFKYKTIFNQVYAGKAKKWIRLGDETPVQLSIVLMRWFGLDKDDTEVDMPYCFRLNGYTYRLCNVIYHHGVSPNSGHYTSGNRKGFSDNWQYRNDGQVGDDLSFDKRKNSGYIYTYERIRIENIMDRSSFFDLKNP